MKKTILLLFIIFGFATFAQTIVITDINVIPISTNTLLQHQDVHIKNGIIEKILPHEITSSEIKNAKVINGDGKYLIPGLADMHVHLPDGNEPITKEQAYTYYLQNGVTVLRSMRGELSHPKHRDSIQKGLIKAPKLYISYSLPDNDNALTQNDINEFIKLIKTNHFDFVKYMSGISDAKMIEVSTELKDNRVIFAGHAYKDVKTSVKLGFRSIEHISPLVNSYLSDSTSFDKLLGEMKSDNVSYCPTESFSKIVGFQFTIDENMNRNGMKIIDTALANKWKRDYVNYLSRLNKAGPSYYGKQARASKNEIDIFNYLLRRMLKAGVNVLLGPDNCFFNVPGYSMVEEMKLYKEAGISNYDVLKISTSNAASFFNETEKWGTITKGKEASLVVLDKNPLENIENIKSVSATLVKGKILFEKK